jgi:tol-pal system protein YbgF
VNVLRFSAVLLPLLGACATQHDVQRAQQGSQALRTGIANVEASVANVRRELAELRGEVETIQHRIERVARERPAPEVQDLEARIAKLEQSEQLGHSPAPPPRQEQVYTAPFLPPPGQELPLDPLTRPVPAHATERPAEMLREQQEYGLALELLRAEDYEQAVQQFRTFQRTYPASDMADDALYWIGEIYFIQQDYNRAILALNDVVLQYGKGDRRPDALVRQAEAFLEIGDRRSTRLILRKVIDDYPGSAVIPKAKSLLQSLEP